MGGFGTHKANSVEVAYHQHASDDEDGDEGDNQGKLDDSAPGFCYKNHYVIDGSGALIWLTRWVNRKMEF